MVERVKPLIGAMAAFATIALSACGRGSEQEPRRTELSGPVGVEHSVHPRFTGAGRTVLPGCCSFDAARGSWEVLEGDAVGRRLERDGFRIEGSFGNGLGRAPLGPNPKEIRTIDGIRLARFDTRGSRHGAAISYFAVVPLDEAAHRARIKDPGLEIRIWCSSDDSCTSAVSIAEGVRF